MINEHAHNVTDVVIIVIPLFELLGKRAAHLLCYRDIIPDIVMNLMNELLIFSLNGQVANYIRITYLLIS